MGDEGIELEDFKCLMVVVTQDSKCVWVSGSCSGGMKLRCTCKRQHFMGVS